MINRREFVGITLGAGAALALTQKMPFAQQPGTLMQRAIPSSGETLPVVSFGAERRDTSAMKDILETLVDNGGRVVDGAHGGGEPAARTAANELGIQDRFFWGTPLLVRAPSVPGAPPPKPDPAAVRAALEKNFATFKVPTLDLVMVSTVGDVPTHLAVLREMKKEGRVRYIGVSHLAFPANAAEPPFGPLESAMRNEQIDFVATDYHVGDRRAEKTILPLAQERKIAFMAYFTFDRGRFFGRVCSTPLPDWAAEFDAKTWAQFCVKYVISQPAVTVARTGTTKAAHMLDNIGGGIGRLPNEAMRKRMAELVDSLPPAPAGSGFSRGPGC
jgi:aryl-alcohol dehydrogenase-like predicted oxidoreductase